MEEEQKAVKYKDAEAKGIWKIRVRSRSMMRKRRGGYIKSMGRQRGYGH